MSDYLDDVDTLEVDTEDDVDAELLKRNQALVFQ